MLEPLAVGREIMVTTEQVLAYTVRKQSPQKKKVTCRTCGLKKCLGQCRWETAPAK
jgi:hypothetical protein